jgi:hypothetical protein
MRLLLPVLLLLGTGCAIADKSDSFGAGIGLETGGVLEYIAPIKFKAFVGFSKTCHDCGKETPHGQEGMAVSAGGTNPPHL